MLGSAVASPAQVRSDAPSLRLSALSGDAAPESGVIQRPSRAAFGAPESNAHVGVLRRAMYTVAGAVVGAGVGYFASHVVYNDWDKASNSTFASRHRTYAIAGSAVGAGIMVVMGGRQGAMRPVSPLDAPRAHDAVGGAPIGPDELAGATGDALDIVRSLRANWLVERGGKRFAEQGLVISADDKGNTVVGPGQPTIQVYLDDAKMGGVDALRQIPVPSIRKIERLTPAEANYRFGAGHDHGVILVTSVGGAGS
jgi:hypothetical protein